MAENQQGDEARARFYLWSDVFRTARHLISAMMWIGVAYFGFKAIETLAGKDTSVWASLSLVKSSHGLPWLLVVIFFVWALGERILRQRKTRSMGAHTKTLETSLDSKRTSSGLLPTGETNPKDK